MWGCDLWVTPADALSWLSCIFWVFAQAPQILHNYNSKSVSGLSPKFLGLWSLGDSLNLISCLLSKDTLAFQILLSLYFVGNDIILCLQYWYYRQGGGYNSIRQVPVQDYPLKGRTSSYDGSTSSALMKVLAAATTASVAQAVATSSEHSGVATLAGPFFAWACTIVYISSRLPQLIKNYRLKSVGGISPLLFASAILGNLTYALSILSSCKRQSDGLASFWKTETPYLVGSLGTLVFDAYYFYQRRIYTQEESSRHGQEDIELG